MQELDRHGSAIRRLRIEIAAGRGHRKAEPRPEPRAAGNTACRMPLARKRRAAIGSGLAQGQLHSAFDALMQIHGKPPV